jgi:hypothetical protein
MANTPTAAQFPNIIPVDHRNSGGSQRGDGDLPNKGYVFVTYSDVCEAELAIKRISGVIHFERRLVCRPGLPKGTQFRQADMGNGPGFYRGGKRRRDKMFRGDRFQDRYDGQSQGGATCFDSSEYGYAPRGMTDFNYAHGGGCNGGKARHSMDSGYRSAAPSAWKRSVSYGYGNIGDYYQVSH